MSVGIDCKFFFITKDQILFRDLIPRINDFDGYCDRDKRTAYFDVWAEVNRTNLDEARAWRTFTVKCCHACPAKPVIEQHDFLTD